MPIESPRQKDHQEPKDNETVLNRRKFIRDLIIVATSITILSEPSCEISSDGPAKTNLKPKEDRIRLSIPQEMKLVAFQQIFELNKSEKTQDLSPHLLPYLSSFANHPDIQFPVNYTCPFAVDTNEVKAAKLDYQIEDTKLNTRMYIQPQPLLRFQFNDRVSSPYNLLSQATQVLRHADLVINNPHQISEEYQAAYLFAAGIETLDRLSNYHCQNFYLNNPTTKLETKIVNGFGGKRAIQVPVEPDYPKFYRGFHTATQRYSELAEIYFRTNNEFPENFNPEFVHAINNSDSFRLKNLRRQIKKPTQIKPIFY